MMTGENLGFMCAILNSSAATWFVSKLGLTTGMGLTQWKKFVVEKIPIVKPDEKKLVDFDHTVIDLLTISDAGNANEFKDIDNAIDRMVLDLYGFTRREAKALNQKEF